MDAVAEDPVAESQEAPANAADKTPFSMRYRDAMDAPWTTITNPAGIVYGVDEATWIDDGAQTTPHPSNVTHRFYQPILR